MSHMSDLLTKWSHQNITVESAIAEWDEYGHPVTSTGISVTALIQYNTKAAINREGKTQVSNCQILLTSDSTISVDDIITLPDGNQPVIISIEKTVDFDGKVEYIKVYT